MLHIAVYLLSICLAICITFAVIYVVREKATRNAKGFPDARRGLFVFRDGGRIVRSVDPIQALLALEDHPKFRFDLHPRRADEGDKEAIEIIADAVRQAFSVRAYTKPGEPGLTVAECRSLLNAFVLYIDAQKKSTEFGAISAQSTEPTSSDSGVPITSDMSPSGYAVTEQA